MRKFLLILTVAGIVGSAACVNTASRTITGNNTAPAAAGTPKTVPDTHEADNAPRITLADAKKDYDAGNAFIIDVRDEKSYSQEHISGAANVTVQTLEANVGKIPKGKKLIVYCSWPSEHSSASLVSELKKKGFENAFALVGGTKVWKDAGYPMEKSK